MIQDIQPKVFSNSFKTKVPTKKDYVLSYQNNKILLIKSNDIYTVPTFEYLEKENPTIYQTATYVFDIDEMSFYLVEGLIDETSELAYTESTILRSLDPMWLAFAGITGQQLHRWYESNRFCGCCGQRMHRENKERALKCEACNHIVYPKIAPAVIIGVTDGNRILMTRYANRPYQNYALIAGFVEIGETLEETVRREVMEEVGLKVKNIRYYKSQPWSFSDTLLVGYYAELDGDDKVTLEEDELAEATWFEREAIPNNPSKISLTSEMIEKFREGSADAKHSSVLDEL